ncbi:MAG: glycine cleavage system aminomethyltransferase GcvT [Tissierellia bacterium]|nr:glycine cleavage system aminomethyltransferase GcvT [Tissierellia bacterium]
MSPKKTPLYEEHKKLNGNLVDFAGWYLPVEYEGLIPEHNTVRENVGLFDVSHMGEFMVDGKEALDFLNYTLSNDFSKLEDGQVGYSMILNENGGIIDDLLVYKRNDESFMLVPNAANTKKDFDHLSKFVDQYDVKFENRSDEFGQIAIQGPKSEELLQKFVDIDLSEMGYYHFKENVKYKNYDVLVSRTGYTGEDGFEVYGTPESTVELWNDLLEEGKEFNVKPCGLGCRDTLRFEASMPLYGNEMSDEISPLEVGLKFAVKMDKSDFIGKEATQKLIDKGVERKLIGIQMEKKRIARQGAEVEKDGKKIGEITTGYLSPTLGVCIANALVDKDSVETGDEVDVIIRKKPSKAKVISKQYLKNR